MPSEDGDDWEGQDFSRAVTSQLKPALAAVLVEAIPSMREKL